MSERKRRPFVREWVQSLRDDRGKDDGGRRLPATAKLVGFVLSTYANGDGRSCNPSVATIACDAGLGVRTVRRDLRELGKRGWLDEERSKGGAGPTATNSYTLTLPTQEPRPQVPGSEASTPATHAGVPRPQMTITPARRADDHEVQDHELSEGAALSAGSTAKELVTHFAGSARPRPPSAVVTVCARQVERLLADGVSADQIRVGLDRMLDRGKGPELLASLVFEAQHLNGNGRRARTLLEVARGWATTGAGLHLDDAAAIDVMADSFRELTNDERAEVDELRRAARLARAA